jgi:hypothetical protein
MPKVIYTKWLFWADGFTWSPKLVFIRPECRDDVALLMHELKHVEQMEREGTWRMRWWYVTNRKARLEYEIEAYRESVRYDPRPEWYVQRLMDTYGFEITRREAMRRLTGTS